MKPFKIIILQDELPKLDILKNIFSAIGYTLEKKHLSDQDALFILNKGASQLAFFDIQIFTHNSDQKINPDSTPKDRNHKKAQDSIFTLESSIRKRAYEKSKDQETPKAEDFSTNLSSWEVSSKQKEATSSHSFIFKENLFIRSNNQLIKLKYEDIIYVEADANYTQVFTTEKKYIIRSSMKDLQEKLDDKRFARVHKSFLINLEKIESIQAEYIQIIGKEIPIGRQQYSWLIRQITIL